MKELKMSLKKERRNRKKVKKSEHRWRTCKVKQNILTRTKKETNGSEK